MSLRPSVSSVNIGTGYTKWNTRLRLPERVEIISYLLTAEKIWQSQRDRWLGTNCQVPGTNVVPHEAGYKLQGARDECGATWSWVQTTRCQGRMWCHMKVVQTVRCQGQMWSNMALGTKCQVPGTIVVPHEAGHKVSGARDKCGATWSWVKTVRCQGRLWCHMKPGTNFQVPGTNVVPHGAGYKLPGARDKCGATWRWVQTVRCQGRLWSHMKPGTNFQVPGTNVVTHEAGHKLSSARDKCGATWSRVQTVRCQGRMWWHMTLHVWLHTLYILPLHKQLYSI